MKILIVSLLLTVFTLGLVEAELKGVALLFRHGQRTPIFSLPNYGNSEMVKEIGFGQLTLVSKVTSL